jgi:hypothetical protein
MLAEIKDRKKPDYNFDGIEDLVISNGNYAPYGGMSSAVFLFSKARGKFVKDEKLTQLASENMTVTVNKKLKYIETFTKSGCCWHQKVRYCLGCLKEASRAQFSCPGFGPRSPPTPQYLGQLIGFSA